MSDTTLLIDSTTVMPKALIEERGVTVIPVPINVDGKEYREGITITPKQFHLAMETSKQRPSTAVPGIGEFTSYYDRLLERHKNIVYPTPSALLSGVFNSAAQGASQVEGAKVVLVDPLDSVDDRFFAVDSQDPETGARLAEIAKWTEPTIVVMNTASVSAGCGLVGMEVCDAIQKGQPIVEIVRRMIDAKQRSGIYVVLNTLEYVVDRVGGLSVFLGTLLKLKPVLMMKGGNLVDAAKTRGERQARAKMIELVKERVGGGPIDAYVLHSFAPEKVEGFLAEVLAGLDVRTWWVDDIGCSVARYTGRGGLGLAFREV